MTIFESLKNSGKSIYLRLSYVLVAFLFAFLTISPAYAASDFTVHATPACSAPTAVLAGDFWCGTTTITRMDDTGSLVASYDIRALTGQSTLNIAGIAPGGDGNIWFSGVVGNSVKVGQLNISTGNVTLTNSPLSSGYDYQYSAPVADGDGNIWFYVKVRGGTVKRDLVRVDTSTGVAAVRLTSDSYSVYSHIGQGGDGSVCWSDTYYKRLECRKVTPTGQLTGSSHPLLHSDATDIIASTPGPDGSFWYIANNRIFKLNSSGNLIEYALPSGTVPKKIVKGSDNAVWYTDAGVTKKIHRISASGNMQEYPTPPSVTQVSTLILGQDDAIWFNAGGGQLGRLAVTPDLTTQSVATAPQIITQSESWGYTNSSVLRINSSGSTIANIDIHAVSGQTNLTIGGLAIDTENNAWFTAISGGSARLGRIDSLSGKVAIYYGPFTGPSGQQVSKPVIDRHGGVWYYAKTPYGASTKQQLIRVDTILKASSVVITSDTSSSYSAISAGADDRIWVTDTYYKRFIAKGSNGETFYPLPSGVNDTENLTAGIDGNLWFTANGNVYKVTPGGVFTEYPLPIGAVPTHLDISADGSVWYTDNGTTKKISRLVPGGSVSDYDIPADVTQLKSLTIDTDGTIQFSALTSNGPTINKLGY